MNETLPSSGLSAVDRGFLAARAQALELAAFLDRLDRVGGDAAEDPRVAALRAALPILTDGQDRRAARMLDAWSDPTTEPADDAVPGAACGVYTPAEAD